MKRKRMFRILALIALVPLLGACAIATGGGGLPPGAMQRCAAQAGIASVVGGAVGAGGGAILGTVIGTPAKGAAIGGVAAAGIAGASVYQQCLEDERAQAYAATAAAIAAAAAAPQERCQWVYDHTGAYMWSCSGAVGPRSHPGPPPMPLPPAPAPVPLPGMKPVAAPVK